VSEIPIGGVTYIIWRVKSDWRRPADAAAQRERARYFATNGAVVPVGALRTSGLAFEDVGEYELKGLSDHWRLLRVVPEPG
jgi:hypothetical protein